MELTQEQIDAKIAEAIATATAGLMTPEDHKKALQQEVDRRVQSGIDKGVETEKSKWLQDYEAQAQLTAEERAKKEVQDRISELEGRESQLAIGTNRLTAKQLLAKAEVPASYYEKLIDKMITADADATTANIKNVIETYQGVRTEIETQLKASMSKVPSPTTDPNPGEMTKEQFMKLPYAQMQTFKKEHPEIAMKFMK